MAGRGEAAGVRAAPPDGPPTARSVSPPPSWSPGKCSGAGTEPYTDAQFESVARLVVAGHKVTGLPINRSTVVVHADINSVSRRSDPWPPSTREARVRRVISRANAILRPPIATAAVKAGDTPGSSTRATSSA